MKLNRVRLIETLEASLVEMTKEYEKNRASALARFQELAAAHVVKVVAWGKQVKALKPGDEIPERIPEPYWEYGRGHRGEFMRSVERELKLLRLSEDEFITIGRGSTLSYILDSAL